MYSMLLLSLIQNRVTYMLKFSMFRNEEIRTKLISIQNFGECLHFMDFISLQGNMCLIWLKIDGFLSNPLSVGTSRFAHVFDGILSTFSVLWQSFCQFFKLADEVGFCRLSPLLLSPPRMGRSNSETFILPTRFTPANFFLISSQFSFSYFQGRFSNSTILWSSGVFTIHQTGTHHIQFKANFITS